MNAEVLDRVKTMEREKIIKLAAIGIIVVLVLGAAFWVYNNKFRTKNLSTAARQTTTMVKKGDFSVTVSGSGPINSSNRLDVTPMTNGTITKIYHKEGDTVKAGDLMFEMDDYAAKLNVEKIKTNIAQSQLTQKGNLNDINKLTITAPFSGQISNIQVKQGDTLNKGATLLTLKDQSKLKMTVSFNASNFGDISEGKQAIVHIQSLMQSVKGFVSYVSNKTFTTASGGEVFSVEITVENPGSLNEGMKANAEITTPKGVQSSTDSGTLAYVNNSVIKTDTGGTVKNLNIKENQYVKSGDVLIALDNDEVLLTKETTDVKLLDFQGQLDSAQKELSHYKIYAPIDGTIVKQTLREGDVVKSGQVISTLADGKQLEFSVPIDELDIAKVKVGQKVNITVDAVPETTSKPLQGEVSKIAIEGNYSNGVTTYSVTIKVSNPENLRGGMNANAEILVTSKKGVLYLPIEAVTKMPRGGRAFVWVKEEAMLPEPTGETGVKEEKGKNKDKEEKRENKKVDDSSKKEDTSNTITSNSGGLGYSAQGNNRNSGNQRQVVNPNQSTATTNGAMINPQLREYYANAVMREVELGINNESYVEIVSGLSEGEEVVLPPRALGQNSTNRQTGGSQMGGAMPFMGGGSSSGAGGNVRR